MPFLDFRIVLWFDRPRLGHGQYILCPPRPSWNVVSATDHIRVGIICYYGLSMLTNFLNIKDNFKTIATQLLPIAYWSSTLLVYLGYFDCFSMRRGLDLGVRYSRISFLCLFLTADIPSAADGRPILFQSIKKLPS